ncbi:hypothetical protein MMC12_007552 [Toensbergia leucococca]|nr:hypothetical protein [Toensbergia leucococca]
MPPTAHQTRSEEIEDLRPFGDLESPPFSPVSFIIERPSLSPGIESELRRSCAAIPQDCGPVGPVYEDITDNQKDYKKNAEDHNLYKALSQPRVTKTESGPAFLRAHRRQRSDPVPGPVPYTHIPRNAATSFELTATRRKPSIGQTRDDINFEPLEPARTTLSTKSQPANPETEDPLCMIRAALPLRPKTSAAACIDYDGPSADTSASTSRTTTTYEGLGRTTSTGLTSQARTPGDEQRNSYNKQRVSEQILQDGAAASLADATAKAWMTEVLARRRADSTSEGPQRPASRASVQRNQIEPERPKSRAGSIQRGLKEYIRPSMEGTRPTKSENDLSRPTSRAGGSIKAGTSNSWWRGKLERKGSWSSFRSVQPSEEDDSTTREGERGVDLNRALPALPGLDQYKEKKPAPLHIAHLMRAGGSGQKHSSQRPTVIDDEGLERTLSKKDERTRIEELRRAVEEKMKVGAISPPASPGLQSLVKNDSRQRSSDSRLSVAPSVTVVEIQKTPGRDNKRIGLMRRLSRFWSFGNEKRPSVSMGRKSFNGAVAVN